MYGYYSQTVDGSSRLDIKLYDPKVNRSGTERYLL